MCSRNLDNKTEELLAMFMGGTSARRIEARSEVWGFSFLVCLSAAVLDEVLA
jgi:hypothetical protein